jgi:hypothetical protein
MRTSHLGLLFALVAAAALSGSLCTAGETLYNGIVLPDVWPPKVTKFPYPDPVTPPYLVAQPAVIPIDVGRQLFVDDFLVARTTLTRTHHLPKYHPDCPVLKPDQPAEHGMAMVFSDGVWYDPKDRIFKAWYSTGNLQTAYATSKDGIHWDKKPLADPLTPNTNVMKGYPGYYRDSNTVWLDLETADLQQRFKMMNWAGNHLHFSVSPDGLTWKKLKQAQHGGDRNTIFYNPFRQVWVYSLRGDHYTMHKRCRYYHEGKRFEDYPGDKGPPYSDPHADTVMWACADNLDEAYAPYGVPAQLYNLDCTPYESVMLGLFSIWQGDCQQAGSPRAKEDNAAGRPKMNAVTTGYSRDGFHFSRPDRRAFLPYSETKGDWNWGNVQSAGGGCLVVGDEIWFYCSGRMGKSMPGVTKNNGGGNTGLATLRRDGFVSMDGPGELTTRLVTFKGKHMFVNVDNPDGELIVEVLDQNGEVIQPFTKDNCISVKTDKTLHPVNWKGAGDLSAVSGKAVCFRFHLTGGKLYAFWVSPDASGASYGYVGAGGPGFTGSRDTVGMAAYEAAKALPAVPAH